MKPAARAAVRIWSAPSWLSRASSPYGVKMGLRAEPALQVGSELVQTQLHGRVSEGWLESGRLQAWQMTRPIRGLTQAPAPPVALARRPQATDHLVDDVGLHGAVARFKLVGFGQGVFFVVRQRIASSSLVGGEHRPVTAQDAIEKPRTHPYRAPLTVGGGGGLLTSSRVSRSTSSTMWLVGTVALEAACVASGAVDTSTPVDSMARNQFRRQLRVAGKTGELNGFEAHLGGGAQLEASSHPGEQQRRCADEGQSAGA